MFKRFFTVLLGVSILLPAVALAGYSMDPVTGLYVDETGAPVSELWDDAGGLYIVNGIGHPIVNVEQQSYVPEGMIVESGQMPIDLPEDTHTPMDPKLWQSKFDQYQQRNGITADMVYVAPNGAEVPVEMRYLGLGRCTVLKDGKEYVVPTYALHWATDVPENKVLAVVHLKKQSSMRMFAEKSTKSFVMARCFQCQVLMVIRIEGDWAFVEANGVRGYVKKSTLKFYSNVPMESYQSGRVSVNGRLKGDTVHIRAKGSNSSKYLSEVPCGAIVTVFQYGEKWCEVDVYGFHCFIATKYITFDE